MQERIFICVHPSRTFGGPQRINNSFVRVSQRGRLIIVVRNSSQGEFRVRGMNANESVTGAAVQAHTISRRQVFIDRFADQRMGELEPARNIEVRLNDTRLYGRFEAGQYGLHILVHGDGNLTSRELPAMDGRDAEQFVATVRESNQPSANGLVYASGNLCGHRCDFGSRALINKDLDQLDGEQDRKSTRLN